MGVLTSGSNGQSFSTFVMFFGILLLVCSSVYLRNLKNKDLTANCGQKINSESPDGPKPDPGDDTAKFCENLDAWKNCAIVGIVIGCIDLFIGPAICCCVLSAVCGFLTCTACLLCCFGGGGGSSEETETSPATQPLAPNDPENPDTEKPDATPQKSSMEKHKETIEQKLQSPSVTVGCNLVEIIFAIAPLACTAYICLTLYSTDAIRMKDDKLYKWALGLFLVSVLNSMVFAQKVLAKLCGNVVTGSGVKGQIVGQQQNGTVTV